MAANAANYAVSTAHGMANALDSYKKFIDPSEETKLDPRGGQ